MAAPLAKTDEIVLLSGSSSLSNEISKFVSQVPPAVQALTGVNLNEVIAPFILLYHVEQHHRKSKSQFALASGVPKDTRCQLAEFRCLQSKLLAIC